MTQLHSLPVGSETVSWGSWYISQAQHFGREEGAPRGPGAGATLPPISWRRFPWSPEEKLGSQVKLEL